MTPDNRGGPRKGRPDTTDQPPRAYADPHVIAMYGMAWRIRWLSTRRSDGRYPRHWWLRHPDGRAQLEFLERRGAA